MSEIPKILALDTSTVRGSVAILEGSEIMAEVRLRSAQTHSTLLLSSIDFLLKRLGWKLGDLTLVAAGVGPGSFTGIRIGVATALGISQSLSIPFAGISGLDALALQAEFLNGRVGVLLDAHRSQVYYGEYICGSGKIRSTRKSMLVDISDLERLVADRHLYIVGDVNVYRFKRAKRSSQDWPRIVPVDMFLAAGIGRLAVSRKRTWVTGNNAVSEPMYIRPPDALKNKGRKR